MSLRARLLIAVGLLGLVAAPAIVLSAGIGQGCSGSWKSPQHQACRLISEDKLAIYASSTQPGSGTVRATTVIDGIERTLATCSFGGSTKVDTPAIVPTPEAITVIVEVTPAPTNAPTIKATVTPPSIGGNHVSHPQPGGCAARANTPRGLEIDCRIHGTGGGIFGCNAYSEE